MDFNGKTIFVYRTALLHIFMDSVAFDIRFCLDFAGSVLSDFIQNVSVW